IVGESAGDSVAVFQQSQDGAFHMHVDALVDPMILERSNHLKPGAITDMREPRVSVSAEVALKNFPIGCAIEHGSPRLELAHSGGGLFRMQLRHSPVVDVLTSAHRVGEVDLPVVALVHVGERGSDSAFGHYGMSFSQERLAHEPDGHSRGGSFDCGSKACAARPDHQYVVLECLVFSHQKSLLSDQI